jgi:hypothetical protein
VEPLQYPEQQMLVLNGSPLDLKSNNGGTTDVIVWNEIIPGANMVWTPIVPY